MLGRNPFGVPDMGTAALGVNGKKGDTRSNRHGRNITEGAWSRGL